MKTKRLILAYIAVFMLWLPPLSAMGEVVDSCKFTLSDWSCQVEDVQGFLLSNYDYAGLHCLVQPGQPMLPSRRVSLAVPYNASGFTITVTDSTTTDLTEPFTVKPRPLPLKGDDSGDEESPVFDTAVYGTDAFFPTSPVMVGGDGYYMGENHLLSLDVFPMRYNPHTGTLRRYTSLTFTVTWTTSETQAARAIVPGNPNLRLRARDEVTAMVDNPAQAASFAAPIQEPMLAPPLNAPSDTLGHYLIVTTDSLAHAIRRIAALKRQKGYRVDVRTMTEILADTSVQAGDARPKKDGTMTFITDNAGKLRQYIRKNFQDNGTEYVLLAGKSVPFRYGYLNENDSTEIESRHIPSDWYFSELNSNWNINENQYYGERDCFLEVIYGNRLDMHPDLYVGRLMFENATDVENYSSKLIEYEILPSCGSTNHLGRAFETLSSKFHDGTSIKNSLDAVFSQTSIHNIDYNDYTIRGKELIQDINTNGYGFWCIAGHGHPNRIQTNAKRSGSTGEKPPYNYLFAYEHEAADLNDGALNQLQSRLNPAVMYAISCVTMPFDAFFSDDDSVYYAGRNMGQSFTLERDYGGIAYIGHTRDCLFCSNNLSESSLLAYEFTQCLADSIYCIGKASALSKSRFYNYIDRNSIGNNLMGDPEFEMWTSSLTPFDSVRVIRSDNGIVVSGIDASNFETTVSFCNNTNQGKQVWTGGTLSFNSVDPNSVVMVRRHDKLPYIAPLVLQNTTIENSQYIIAHDVVAGSNVDAGRTVGKVTIAESANYEIEYKGMVTFAPGFEVEKGARLTVRPSEY
ncbi:MAG: hypothetical protein IJT30_01405 [Muribaculaceae bacterium]|nr:hypothetical protein [Muribaculaceae bacterium]